MRKRPSALLVTTALFLAPLAGQAVADEAPIRAITIFEAGISELVREIPAGEVTLRIPTADVDDVLKSLTLFGEGSGIARLTLSSKNLADEAFFGLPITAAALSDPAELLAQLTGHQIRFPASDITGQVIGVLPAEACDAGKCDGAVMIMDSGKEVRRIPLVPDLRFEILDPAMARAVQDAAEAMRATLAVRDMRDISLKVRAEDDAELAASYVIASPLWKTAYRASLGADGASRLEAWAIVENATSEDWTDVRMTLSSGSPRAMSADLFAQAWGARELYEAQAPQPLAKAERSMFAMDSLGGAEAATMSAPVAQAAFGMEPAAQGVNGNFDTRFTFPEPIDLAAGEILSLPFLADSLQGRHYLAWRGSDMPRSGSPELRFELRNDLPVRLPSGIMTVRDEETGYVGDAAFPMIAPGDLKSVTFGQDPEVIISQDTTSTTRTVDILRTEAGVLVRDIHQVETRYRLTAPPKSGKEIVIEHPLRQGWTYDVQRADGLGVNIVDDGAAGERMEITAGLSADEAREITVRAESPYEQVYPTRAVSLEMLTQWLGDGQRSVPARDWILAAIEIRMAEEALIETEARVSGEKDRALDDQARLLRLIDGFEKGSKEHGRFIADLVSSEEEIRAMDTRLGEIRNDRERLASKFDGLGLE